MFGKRSAASDSPRPASAPPPRVEPAPARVPAAAPAADGATSTLPQSEPPQLAPQASKAVAVLPDARSEDYYQIKTTIFSALIDTIDLAQLAQLDPDSAREEIRDIVNEIISIKAVVMSIAEQESLLQDICNDVL